MKKLFFLFFTVLFVCSVGFGQDSIPVDSIPLDSFTEARDTSITVVPPEGGVPTVRWLFNAQNGIYGLLLYVIMWLSGFIPGLKKLDDKRLRALIVGLILAGGLVIWQLFEKDLHWQDFVGMAFTFISTQLAYIFVLAPIPPLRTPEPEKK